MMKTARSSKVAVSLASPRWKRMTPPLFRAPAISTRPRTRSALAKIDPSTEYWATTSSPAEIAKRTTKSSGRLPSVD
jgi:hypothetical protein